MKPLTRYYIYHPKDAMVLTVDDETLYSFTDDLFDPGVKVFRTAQSAYNYRAHHMHGYDEASKYELRIMEVFFLPFTREI